MSSFKRRSLFSVRCPSKTERCTESKYFLPVFLIFYLNRTEGSTVVVSVDGKKVAEYPLSVDGTYYLNNGTNVLVIEDGYAYISEANCPGFQDCVEEGKKHFVGETITCLPNKLIVEITGEGEGFDI